MLDNQPRQVGDAKRLAQRLHSHRRGIQGTPYSHWETRHRMGHDQAGKYLSFCTANVAASPFWNTWPGEAKKNGVFHVPIPCRRMSSLSRSLIRLLRSRAARSCFLRFFLASALSLDNRFLSQFIILAVIEGMAR